MTNKKLRLDKQLFFFRDYFSDNKLTKSNLAMFKVLEFHTHLRKDGSPEATHMFDVAGSTLSLLQGRVSTSDLDILVSSGFLHDLVEDYSEQYSFEQLKVDFGSEVYDIVKLISKPLDFCKSDDDYNLYYENVGSDFRSVILKAEDRIDNFKSMKNVFTIKRQREYIAEAKKYILPMLKEARSSHPDLYMVFIDLSQRLNELIDQYEWFHSTLEELGLLKSTDNKKLPELLKRHNKSNKKSSGRRI